MTTGDKALRIVEAFIWVVVLVFVADNQHRYAILDSDEVFIMLSVVAGVRVGGLVSGINYPSGRWAGFRLTVSVVLPFAVLLVVLTLALLARFLWMLSA